AGVENLQIIKTSDDDEDDIPEGHERISCNQCEMLMINGVPCHETGCPNMGARWDRDMQDWVKQRECFECGSTVDADDPCCSAEPEYEEPQIEYQMESYQDDPTLFYIWHSLPEGGEEIDEENLTEEEAQDTLARYNGGRTGSMDQMMASDEKEAAFEFAEDTYPPVAGDDGRIQHCPSCESDVRTVPCEGVPNQALRCCNRCGTNTEEADMFGFESSDKTADTADNPANENGGEGAIEKKTDHDVAKTASGYVCPACESGICGDCKNQNPSGNKPCTHGRHANQKKADTADNPANEGGKIITIKTDAEVSKTAGRTLTPKYVIRIPGSTDASWDVKSNGQLRGAGKPNDANLARYMDALIKSINEPNGFNAHLKGRFNPTEAAIYPNDGTYKNPLATWSLRPQDEKHSADISNDMSEAKSEVSSPDTVDKDIKQPTESVEQAGKQSADISGDMSEVKSEVDYNKSEVADEPEATDTVNPEHFAGKEDFLKGPWADKYKSKPQSPKNPRPSGPDPAKEACAAFGDEEDEERAIELGLGDLADLVVEKEPEGTKMAAHNPHTGDPAQPKFFNHGQKEMCNRCHKKPAMNSYATCKDCHDQSLSEAEQATGVQ